MSALGVPYPLISITNTRVSSHYYKCGKHEFDSSLDETNENRIFSMSEIINRERKARTFLFFFYGELKRSLIR